ncbi:MAG: hypothetical protein N2645_22775 [Clostridia bacterium]|nr:hypothetical protein [Clostridia bacterium]
MNNMTKSNFKFTAILYFTASVLFIISAVNSISKNNTTSFAAYLLLGALSIYLAIKRWKS